MAKQEIAFGLKIDGIEQSIKSVKDLKGAISAMQTEAENADIGSDQYKNAIENIEKLNDKLKEVTQTEKQAAKATEDLAKAEQEAAKETGDLRKQFEVLEDELFMLAGQGKQNTKEFRDLANEAALLNKKIEQVNQSLEGGAATKSAEGFQMLSGGLTSIKDGLLELDFGKVKDGLMQAKQGFVMFGQGAKTALSGVKGALLATGIGAFIVALGLIIAYWDDIKGAVSGVSAEQKKLNEDSAANLQTQQDKLTAISAQENTLKLQGKTEKEILQMKEKQTDEAIMASDIAIQQAENTKIAQVEASKRNRDILQGIIKFVTAPITILLQGIDSIGSALGQNFNLLEKFSGGLANLVFDPEEVAAEGDKVILEQKAINTKLRNDRDGLRLSINKIDDDAKKTASENAKKNADEQKKLRDEKLAAEIAAMKQIQDANIANEQNEQNRLVKKAFLDQQRRVEEINKTVTDETLKAELLKASEKTFQNEMAAIYQTKLDKDKAANEKAAADKKAAEEKLRAETNAENTAKAELDVLKQGNELNDLINQLTVKRDIDLQNKDLTASQKLLIDEKYAQDVHKLETDAEKAKQDEIVKIAEQGLQSAQNLSDIFFLFKKSKAEKGSKEETELARKQFNVNKALQIGMATIDGFKAITSILAQYPKFDGGIAMAAALVATGTASAATIAKIAATKFESGGGAPSAGGGGGGVPSIPPPPTIATPENNTNKTTSFDETGKNLNFQGNATPTINVKASVGVDEITSKSNRVEVLENQSTF
jgi:chemotaxis protein histidine kinase CheA